jgi:hypothetical protein
MARDSAGLVIPHARDEQGRPLKLKTPPPTPAYVEGWERIFGKKEKLDDPRAENREG